MKQVRRLQQLNKATYFNIKTLQSLLNIDKEALYANVKRWLKNGELIQLKRGVYTTKDYLAKQRGTGYSEYLANMLSSPSYLSMEYVLQKYAVLSEAVFAYTSITLKKPRNINNIVGKYIYSNISEKFFIGYSLIKTDNFEIAIATKSKALFDFLYIRLYRTKDITSQLVESFRLNLDEFTDADFKEFSKYCQLSGQKKFINLVDILQALRALKGLKNDY